MLVWEPKAEMETRASSPLTFIVFTVRELKLSELAYPHKMTLLQKLLDRDGNSHTFTGSRGMHHAHPVLVAT